MAHLVITRTLPVSLKQGYDYIDDYRTWPRWYSGMLEIVSPAVGHRSRANAWSQPGDVVRFAYRLLGRRVVADMVLEERVPEETTRCTAHVPGLPDVHTTWRFMAAGEDLMTVSVAVRTDEQSSFFGKTIDRLLVPRTVERDLAHSLSNLEDIFGYGGHAG